MRIALPFGFGMGNTTREKRRLNRAREWLTDVDFRGPSEEWDIEYMVWDVCGYSDGAGRRRRRQI